MPQTLYVATGSAGKLRDFAAAAATIDANWQIEALPGLRTIPAPPEDGATFLENARFKALYYGRFLPEAVVIADDSGLSVDVLGGAPGVYSARYASIRGFEDSETANRDDQGRDERNNRCLLADLTHSGVPEPWPAHYRCVLAAAHSGEIIATAEGAVCGEIVITARGKKGFGYDPYFSLVQPDRRMAELDLETRLRLNHRGNALRTLLPQLAALLS